MSTISDRAQRAVLALCVAAGLGGCHGSSDGGSLVGTLERDRIEIIAQADEPIIAIAVREGDHVTRGELLLQQELTSATARTAEASANAAGAQHRLAELVAGPRVEELTEARAHVASAKATFERDARELQRASDLVPQHLISQTQFDDARAARDRSAAQLHDAQAQLTALERGTRIEQLDQARAALAAAQSAREQVSVTAARLTVSASRDGIVEALPYHVGERPRAGAPVAILLADGLPFARVYVPEAQRSSAHPGASARVRLDGVTEELAGRVRFVSSQAAFTPYYALTQADRGHLAYLMEVELTDPAARTLPAGLPVAVRLETGDGGR